jgi:division protein CdvB (Snf7/Vps24/ESCRT-III family)
MAFLFGGAPSKAAASASRPANPFREQQRDLRHGIRSLDREDLKAARDERAFKAEILKLARDQRLDLCKAKAREMIRLRCHRNRLTAIKFHMNSLAQQLATVQSTHQLQAVMGRTTRLLQGLNRSMDPRAVHRMLCEFERQSTAMTDSQEVLQETLDSMFETDDEASATDDAMAQVFQELGIDMQGRLAALPAQQQRAAQPEPPPPEGDLEARLNRLRT